MQPHEERVMQEKRELDDKLRKLRQFFFSTTFTALPLNEHIRLYRQEMAMEMYSKILGERIAAFGSDL